MPQPNWDDELLTGDAIVDEQHRRLFELADELGHALDDGREREVIGDIVRGILEYAAAHFTAEEALMERISYPGLGHQRAAHEAFAEDAARMAGDFESGYEPSAVVLHANLVDWLTLHVQTHDLLLARFMRAEREDTGTGRDEGRPPAP